VKSRKRPAQTPKESGPPSKRQRKLRKQLRSVLPANTSTTLYTSPQRVGILCLPTELHQHVLSYTSARDAARYRRVCTSTNRLVVGSEKVLLRTYAGGALSRLKEAVDEFSGLKAPHDTDSLIKVLHVWTKRRGYFANGQSFMGSVVKLMAHFFLKKNLENQDDDDDDDGDSELANAKRGVAAIRWAYIAKKFSFLLSYPSEEWNMEKHLSEFAEADLLDETELNKLLEYAKDPHNHRLSGQLWPEGKLEYMTFPIADWRLTPLLKHPKSHSLDEIPEAHNPDYPFEVGSLDWWYVFLDEPDNNTLVSRPDLGNEKVVRYLGLPALPNAITCYWVEDYWARQQIHGLVSRLYNAERRK
jgi:hypothetical protein